MTWTNALLFVAYLVVAAGIWTLGEKLVRKSRAGRQGLPLVALLWPVGVFLLVGVAIVASIDAAFARAADWLGKPE